MLCTEFCCLEELGISSCHEGIGNILAKHQIETMITESPVQPIMTKADFRTVSSCISMAGILLPLRSSVPMAANWLSKIRRNNPTDHLSAIPRTFLPIESFNSSTHSTHDDGLWN